MLETHAGDASAKTRKQYQTKVDAINALEPSMQAMSDEQLRAKTKELQDKYQDGKSLDELLVEAFAVCSKHHVVPRWQDSTHVPYKVHVTCIESCSCAVAGGAGGIKAGAGIAAI